jgi:hypothetical protein
MPEQVPDARRKATARRAFGSLPHAISGPFTLDIDSMVDQACSAVCDRPELIDQLEVLQERPDLAGAVIGQREFIVSSIAEQEDRARKVGSRLHELLVERLTADPDQIEELSVLTVGAEALKDAIQAIDEDLPVQGVEMASPGRERLADLLLTIQPYRLDLETWLQARDSKRPRRRPVLSRPATQSSADLPGDLLAGVQQEQAECRRVVAEIELREGEMLAQQLPVAREHREFRAMVTEWESQQRDIVQTLESAMLSVALTTLNQALTAGSYSASVSGLT